MNWIVMTTTDSKGRTRIWKIKTEGNKILQTWGLEGGKFQETSDTAFAKNVGKKNEIAAEEQAKLEMDRQIESKRRKGYRLVGSNDIIGGEINWHARDPREIVPRNFRPMKPLNSQPSGADKYDILKFSLKRNGMGFLVIVNSFGDVFVPNIRGAIWHDKERDKHYLWERFNYIVDDVKRLVDAGHIPTKTMFAAELVPHKEAYDTADTFDFIGKVCRSLTPKSIELQDNKPCYLYLWGLLYLEGKSMENVSYDVADKTLNSLANGSRYLLPKKYIYRSYKSTNKLLSIARRKEMEGFVVYPPDGVPGGKLFNFNGQIKRPSNIWKAKPGMEDDFILIWNPKEGHGTFGTGKNQRKVGSVAAFQINPVSKELVFKGNVSGGLSDEEREKLATHVEWPKVGTVTFSSWTKYNKLFHPRIERFRDDKTVEECLEST